LEIAAIDAQEQEKLRVLEEGFAETQRKTGEALAQLEATNILTADQILSAWRIRFGPNGEFDAIVLNAIARANALVDLINIGIGAGTSTRPTPPFMRGGTQFRQHGGDEIVSSPTMFMAGEGGPERVVTQPLSSIGGAMIVRWRGPAIPVEGRGQLEGLNLDPVGQAMAQGLVSSITQTFLRQRGNWGR
jgi:hypothetical protein